jgi:hypothetical protein
MMAKWVFEPGHTAAEFSARQKLLLQSNKNGGL